MCRFMYSIGGQCPMWMNDKGITNDCVAENSCSVKKAIEHDLFVDGILLPNGTWRAKHRDYYTVFYRRVNCISNAFWEKETLRLYEIYKNDYIVILNCYQD